MKEHNKTRHKIIGGPAFKNTAGILLSFFILLSVWAAVVFLIGYNERLVLDSEQTIPQPRLVVSDGRAADEPFITMEIFSRSKLENADIAEILTYWETENTVILSENEYLLSLEEAMEKADGCIAFLQSCGVLNTGTDDFSRVFSLYGPPDNTALLMPERYSYWDAALINDEYTVTLRINAFEGGVWYIDVISNNGEYGGIGTPILLTEYEAFIGKISRQSIYISAGGSYRVHNSLITAVTASNDSRILMRLIPYTN